MTEAGDTPLQLHPQPTAETIGVEYGDDAVGTRLRLAQEVAGVGIWDWDLVTGVLVWDEQCAALFGIELSDFDQTIDAFTASMHPDDVLRVQAALGQAIDAGESLDLEYRAVWADGSVRRLLARGQCLADEAGRTVRMIGAVLDVTELRAAADARTRLAAVALRLAEAETVEEVNDVVITDGFVALGAAGGGILLKVPGSDFANVTVSSFYGEEVQRDVAKLPLDADLPAAYTLRTGQALYFHDLDAVLAEFPAGAELLHRARVQALASLPLQTGGRVLGSLSASWTEPRTFTPGEVELVEALAAQCIQALDRVQARERERQVAAAARSMSETLQRSLLTSPPQPDDLEIAVRYQPAGREVQVGGDWYDAFITPDGATSLVIGDVTGHDRTAAAAMGQIRNLLRATSYALLKPPAAVLDALERTMAGLQVEALATVVLARIEQDHHHAGRGMRLLRWSNAGHLPPLLRHGDGTTRLLSTEPDLLLGLLPGTGRVDHQAEIPPEATLLLYTDGLVERRGEDVDTALERLREAFARVGGQPLDDVCDQLLAAPAGDGEDDVALLAVRFHSQ